MGEIWLLQIERMNATLLLFASSHVPLSTHKLHGSKTCIYYKLSEDLFECVNGIKGWKGLGLGWQLSICNQNCSPKLKGLFVSKRQFKLVHSIYSTAQLSFVFHIMLSIKVKSQQNWPKSFVNTILRLFKKYS